MVNALLQDSTRESQLQSDSEQVYSIGSSHKAVFSHTNVDKRRSNPALVDDISASLFLQPHLNCTAYNILTEIIQSQGDKNSFSTESKWQSPF